MQCYPTCWAAGSQTRTECNRDGKQGILTAPSPAKSLPRDAVYLQELAEAQPSLGSLQPNVTVLVYTTKGQELGIAARRLWTSH